MIAKLDLTEQVGRVLWLDGWMDEPHHWFSRCSCEGTDEPEPYPQGASLKLSYTCLSL